MNISEAIKSIRKNKDVEGTYKVTFTNGAEILWLTANSPKEARYLLKNSKAHQIKAEREYQAQESFKSDKSFKLPSTDGKAFMQIAFYQNMFLLVGDMISNGYTVEKATKISNDIIEGKPNFGLLIECMEFAEDRVKDVFYWTKQIKKALY